MALVKEAKTELIQQYRQHETDTGSPEVQIAILNVPAIFAKVNCDAVGAAEDGQDGGRHRIGLLGLPRLSHRSHMVDVDAETNHVSKLCPRIAGHHVAIAVKFPTQNLECKKRQQNVHDLVQEL